MMLTDSDHVLLADLGSVSEARVSISSRKEAVALQELAAVNCTSPYRAPELFEVGNFKYLGMYLFAVNAGKSRRL